LIKIFPEIEFSANCPSDRANLNITGVVIPGMRCLADTTCPTCGVHYYIDLPVGQGLWSPVILNQATSEIYDPLDIEWFSSRLKEGFLNPVGSEIVPIVHKFFNADRIVIVNCLDFLYGHSLLKLLNVQRYLERYPELGCCVLLPTQLIHLVPDGVAEIWEFPVPIKDGWKWYLSLQCWMSKQLTKRKECFLSPVYSHPSNRTYDLRCFVRNLPNISQDIEQHQPIILFSYREDRLWGRSLCAQQYNLQKLYNRLSVIFPNMAFVLVGFGHQNQIRATGANLIDLRSDKFEVERDQLWMAYMSAADCVVGVHGSNMLLPSGLAKSTVELVPRSRVPNTVQDFLFASEQQDIRDSILYYRLLYGNETLSNIQPSTVNDVIVNVLAYSPLNSIWFRFGEEEVIIQNLTSIWKSDVLKRTTAYLNTIVTEPFIIRTIKRVAEILTSLLD